MSDKVVLEIVEKERKSVSFNDNIDINIIPNREQNKKLQVINEYEELKQIYGDDLAKSKKEQEAILENIYMKNEQSRKQHWDQIHRNRIEQTRQYKVKHQNNMVAQKQHYMQLQQQRFMHQKRLRIQQEQQKKQVSAPIRARHYSQYIKPPPVKKRAGSGLLFTR